jgi:hypothetical protein
MRTCARCARQLPLRAPTSHGVNGRVTKPLRSNMPKIDELDYFPRPDDPWVPGGHPDRPKQHGGGATPAASPSLVTLYRSPIRFSPADPHVIADEAERAIIKAGFPVFHRGGALVEPSTEKVPTYGGGNTQITTLREINKARLIDFMSKASSWEKYNLREKKYLAAAPPASGSRGSPA